MADFSSSTLPASTLERSSTSFTMSRRCSPPSRIQRRYSRCFSDEALRALQLHELAEAEDGVQRRAQLVAHVRQEPALGPVGRFRDLAVACRSSSSMVLRSVMSSLMPRKCAMAPSRPVDGGDGGQLPVQLAVLLAVAQLSAPFAARADGLPQVRYTSGPCTPDFSRRGFLPITSSRAYPVRLGELAVHVLDVAQGVGDHDRGGAFLHDGHEYPGIESPAPVGRPRHGALPDIDRLGQGAAGAASPRPARPRSPPSRTGSARSGSGMETQPAGTPPREIWMALASVVPAREHLALAGDRRGLRRAQQPVLHTRVGEHAAVLDLDRRARAE